MFAAIDVKMTEKVFFRFSRFEVFIRSRQWLRLFAFFLVMASLAILNLVTDASLLFWILLAIGVIVPASFLIRYRASNVMQSRRFHLDEPKNIYRIEFPEKGGSFHVAVADQGVRNFRYKGIDAAYRTSNAIYLYVKKGEAYLVPCDQLEGVSADALWSFLGERIPKEKMHDRRHFLS